MVFMISFVTKVNIELSYKSHIKLLDMLCNLKGGEKSK